MSAYMVDRNHIRYLVTAAIDDRFMLENVIYSITKKSKQMNSLKEVATAIGQMLWDENKKSILFRYPDCIGHPERMPGPIQESFDYAHGRNWQGIIEPVQIIKACECYAYQSCEHPGWATSESKEFIEALKSAACGLLEDYDKAEWGAPKEALKEKVI